MNPDAVINFWFKELTPKQWFAVDDKLDREIERRFGDLLKQAARGELYPWRDRPEGRLAEIIVLDQFSRNVYRNTAEAFASDSMALVLAEEAVARGDDRRIEIPRRAFIYLPYMHSESAKIHEIAMTLFNQPGLESNFQYEKLHKAIIDRFGRFPHRNEILGRPSTPEEIEFLKTPGSKF
jgi:uncharacterized protein (DUF924 family)